MNFSPIRNAAGAVVAALLLLQGCVTAEQYQPPKDNVYSSYLAALYARDLGDVDRATQSYLEVLERDPDNVKVLEEAYTYFLFAGKNDDAVALARRLNRLENDHSSSAMLLSLTAFKDRDPEALDLYLKDAKGFGFDVLMAPLMRAWLMAAEGETDRALEALLSLSGNPAFQPFYLEHRAFILDYAGRASEAEVAYLNLLNRDELTSFQPVLAYGALLQRQGRSDEAKDLYVGFQDSAPDSFRLEESLRRLDSGERLDSIALAPDQALAMGALRTSVELSREQAFYASAIYARFALYLDDRFDEAYLFLGNLLSGEENPSLALATYNNVDSEGPYGETAVLRKAFVMSARDRHDEAVEMISAYLERHPENVDVLVTLGDLHRTAENYGDALPHYEKAIALDGEIRSDNWFLYFSRAICYERLDRWPEAEADFLAILEITPDEPDVLNYLGYSWIDKGMNLEEGRSMIERAVEQRPNSGYIIDSLGWAQYLMGEYEEAVDTLERAVALEPGDPTLNDHLGDAYWKAGREREARFQWSHALAMNPTPEARANIEAKIEYGLTLAEAMADDS